MLTVKDELANELENISFYRTAEEVSETTLEDISFERVSAWKNFLRKFLMVSPLKIKKE